MALYFFDTYDDGEVVEDDVGLDLRGVEAARQQASASLAEMARDVLPGSVRRQLAIKVHDGRRPVLEATLTFEAIVLAG